MIPACDVDSSQDKATTEQHRGDVRKFTRFVPLIFDIHHVTKESARYRQPPALGHVTRVRSSFQSLNWTMRCVLSIYLEALL